MDAPHTWRPWSADTDWNKGQALRFLRFLVAKKDGSLPVPRFFERGGPSPFHDDQWVHFVEEGTLRSMDQTVQIASGWDRADPPARRGHQGALTVCSFYDGSGLALRRHPTEQAVYALPTRPYIGDPAGVDPDLLWQPCLDTTSGEAVVGLQPHEMLLPTLGGMGVLRKPILARLAGYAALLRTLHPAMPTPVALYGGVGATGPSYHHPKPENLAHLTHVVDAMTRLARLHLPGRLGLQQGWRHDAKAGQDPRVPTLLSAHPTFGGSFTSAHHKLSFLDLLANGGATLDTAA